MQDILSGIVLLVGAFFVLVAAIGLIRLPDLLMRMHATTKAGTLGAGLILLAVAVTYAEVQIIAMVLATIIFIVLTAPVAAHMIGRAAYYCGVELWPGTIADELKTAYDKGEAGSDPDTQSGESVKKDQKA